MGPVAQLDFTKPALIGNKINLLKSQRNWRTYFTRHSSVHRLFADFKMHSKNR